MNNLKLIIFIAGFFMIFSCKLLKKTDSTPITTDSSFSNVAIPPVWSKNAVIYEVNLRQYTKEGTINSFAKHLPRLKELGADILWIMPPYPIGVKNRKGSLGSPYSISDYTKINPDLGTLPDFKNLVKEIHKLKMKVILDWVGNHTSFDNVWINSHPEWYTKDSLGNITHPIGTDWTDVADLNYDNKEMRIEMIKAMSMWIKDYDVDGFRCDVAGFVPNDFWNEATIAINKIKPVFMLAEWEDPSLNSVGFHMTYGWEFHSIMNQIAQGKKQVAAIDTFLKKDLTRFPKQSYRMNFTDNHDENSWNGTIKERMGNAGDAMNVLAFTLYGMPLLYSGQEVGLNKRLSFFDKDEINWNNKSKTPFYQKLIALHHENSAMWNGEYGALPVRINFGNEKIFAYTREKNKDKVLVILNLSGDKQKIKLSDQLDVDDLYRNIFTNENKKLVVWLSSNKEFKPWTYLVLEKVNGKK